MYLTEIQYDYDDILLIPTHQELPTTTGQLLKNRGDVDVTTTIKTGGKRICPIMSANMTQTGTFELATVLLQNQMMATLHKFYTAEEINEFIDTLPEQDDLSNLFVTIGIRNFEEECTKLQALKNTTLSILIDVPNAYLHTVLEKTNFIKTQFPNQLLAVGNVCTEQGVEKLAEAGADIIKVGVGPSIACDTRIVTGVGRPQLSAVMSCAKSAKEHNVKIIADGGLKNSGDICKALAAGADFCMTGSLFAGCDEANGNIIKKIKRIDEQTLETTLHKEYYGMSSFRAQKENYNQITTTGTSEGVESILIPYTGPLQDTINQIKGGLRSCGTYLGSPDIDGFKACSAYLINRVK